MFVFSEEYGKYPVDFVLNGTIPDLYGKCKKTVKKELIGSWSPFTVLDTRKMMEVIDVLMDFLCQLPRCRLDSLDYIIDVGRTV